MTNLGASCYTSGVMSILRPFIVFILHRINGHSNTEMYHPAHLTPAEGLSPKPDLTTHMRMHPGERPFRCNFYGRRSYDSHEGSYSCFIKCFSGPVSKHNNHKVEHVARDGRRGRNKSNLLALKIELIIVLLPRWQCEVRWFLCFGSSVRSGFGLWRFSSGPGLGSENIFRRCAVDPVYCLLLLWYTIYWFYCNFFSVTFPPSLLSTKAVLCKVL